MSEAAVKSDLVLVPEGETPWEPPAPVAPCAGLKQFYSKNRAQVGFVRTINPCPRSGRISFKQIGDLREYNGQPISLNDGRLLNCRVPQPAGDGSYFQPAATNDPSDFYNALWGSEGAVNRGKDLPVNPIGSWNENCPGTYPTDNPSEDNSFNYRGVQASGNGVRLYATSEARYVFVGYDPNNPGYGIYEWRYYPRTINAVNYIGRFAAGTRLSMTFKTASFNYASDWEQTRGYWSIRGWTQGFFNGSEKVYAEGSSGRKQIRTHTVDIQVDDAYKDIWIALEQKGDDGNDDEQWFQCYDFWIWRT